MIVPDAAASGTVPGGRKPGTTPPTAEADSREASAGPLPRVSSAVGTGPATGGESDRVGDAVGPRRRLPSIAGHTLAVGDVVMNDDGIRYELLRRWDDVAWVAHPIGFHADVILADHALAATGDDRTYWWDA
jgi:hypothetical protein